MVKPIYTIAKSVYYRVRKIPVVGTLAMHIAPRVQKIIRKAEAVKKPQINTLEQIELLSQALVSLQRSINESLIQNKEYYTDAIQQLKNQYHAQIAEYRLDIEGYRDRLEFVRLEILDQCSVGKGVYTGTRSDGKPKILNLEKYEAALAAKNVLLNVGCGHKPLPDHLNVDRRNLPGVDIVAEATDLPFDRDTVAEIYTAHLVEHFTPATLKNTIFPYWLDLLTEHGVLKIIVPDMPAMIEAFAQGDMRFSELAEVTFGKQDYDDDFHYAMFSPGTLRTALISSGFKYVELVGENRTNGICREMEVWARKF